MNRIAPYISPRQPTRQPRTDVQIRWLIRQDLEQVLDIERQCDEPWRWSEADFWSHLRNKNCIGMVIEDQRHVIHGYMVYELHAGEISVVNFRVDLESRRSGLGFAMLEKLKHKLNQQKRSTLSFEVPETCEPMQYFLRDCGLRCVEMIRAKPPEMPVDVYRFVFEMEAA